MSNNEQTTARAVLKTVCQQLCIGAFFMVFFILNVAIINKDFRLFLIRGSSFPFFQDGNILNLIVCVCSAFLLIRFRKRIPNKAMNLFVACIGIIGFLAIICMLVGDGYHHARFNVFVFAVILVAFVDFILLPIVALTFSFRLIAYRNFGKIITAFGQDFIKKRATIPLGLAVGAIIFYFNQEISYRWNRTLCYHYIQANSANYKINDGGYSLKKQWESEHSLQWGANAESHNQPEQIDVIAYPQPKNPNNPGESSNDK